MTSNPYESPSPGNPVKAMIDEPPRGLMAVTIICLILGVLGLMGALGAFFGIAAQFFMESFLDELPDSPNMEFQKANLELQQSMLIPNVIIAFANLVAATGLIIGAIGGITKKASLHSVFTYALYIAAIYCLMKIALTVYVSMGTMGLMQQQFQDTPGMPSSAGDVVKYGMWAGVAFAAAWGIGLAVFYVWSASYIGRPQIKSHFNK